MAVFQSNLGTIKQNVFDKLRLDEVADEDKVEEWINLAYLEVLQVTGGLQKTGTATLTAEVSTYDLPVQVSWIKFLVVEYEDGRLSFPLQRIRLERLLAIRSGNVGTGQEVSVPVYAISGQNQLEIWPEPTTGQSLKFWYSYMPEELIADADEPVIPEPFGAKLLEYGALVEGSRFMKDPLITDYESQYQFWLTRFQTWLNRRMGASSQAFEVWTNTPWVGETGWEMDRTR